MVLTIVVERVDLVGSPGVVRFSSNESVTVMDFGVLVNAFPAALAGVHFGDALVDSAAAAGMSVPAQDADPVPWADTELAALVRSLDVVTRARARLG